MKLDDINFLQDSIRPNFHDGQPVQGGNSYISKPLRVTKYKGEYYALDNRTAASKIFNGHKKTQVEYVPYNEVKSEFKKKNTGDGSFPDFRTTSRYR